MAKMGITGSAFEADEWSTAPPDRGRIINSFVAPPGKSAAKPRSFADLPRHRQPRPEAGSYKRTLPRLALLRVLTQKSARYCAEPTQKKRLSPNADMVLCPTKVRLGTSILRQGFVTVAGPPCASPRP